MSLMEGQASAKRPLDRGDERHIRRDRWLRIALGILYWAAVLAVSVALVVALVYLLESRDLSSLELG